MNRRLGKALSLPEGASFLDEEGRIDMWMFSEKNGGAFPEEGADGIAMDTWHIHEKKVAPVVRSESMQRHFGGSSEAYLHMKRSKRFRDGELGEKAFFYVLNRLLGKRYLTLRASLYDDFENKVDFILVDLKGSESKPFLVDMFVSDDPSCPREMHIASEKSEFFSKKRRNGVKYGIHRTKSGGLERDSLEHLPGIVVPVGKRELKSFYEDLADTRTFDAEPTDAEWEFFEHVVSSFADRLPPDKELKTEHSIPLLVFLELAQRRIDKRHEMRERS